MRDPEIKATLAILLKKMEIIDAKLSQLPQVQVQVSSRFLPTMVALQKLDQATATQVSQLTCRCRAFESKNLNELYNMGLISKQTIGRRKIFAPRTKLTAKQLARMRSQQELKKEGQSARGSP